MCPRSQACVKIGMASQLHPSTPLGPSLTSLRSPYKALVLNTCLKFGKLQCKSKFNRNYSNGLYLPGGYVMPLETTWTSFWSPCTTFLPLCPRSYRKKLSIINTVTSHMSLLNHSQTVRTRALKFWQHVNHNICVMCRVSHVRCDMSLVMYHISHCFLSLQSVGFSLWSVCYQLGLLCIVVKPQYLLILALVVNIW